MIYILGWTKLYPLTDTNGLTKGLPNSLERKVLDMNWDDVEDILFDGTPEQITTVKCPECAGELKMTYFPTTRSYEIYCKKCKTMVRANGVAYVPNFAKVSA